MTEQNRIPLLSKDDLPETYQVYLSEEYRGEPNFFRALANNPPLLEALFEYSTALSESLSSTEREIATLAVSREMEAEYIWHQHVKRALGDELTLEEIQAIGKNETARFSVQETALIEYARAVARHDVSEETHEQMAAHYSNDRIVAIALLIGFYIGLHAFMDAIEISLEDDFVGWVPNR